VLKFRQGRLKKIADAQHRQPQEIVFDIWVGADHQSTGNRDDMALAALDQLGRVKASSARSSPAEGNPVIS